MKKSTESGILFRESFSGAKFCLLSEPTGSENPNEHTYVFHRSSEHTCHGSHAYSSLIMFVALVVIGRIDK